MGHVRAPMYLVCSCKCGERDPVDDVRHPIEGTDSWSAFGSFSEAKAERDRLLDLADTYTAQLPVVLDGDGSYDQPPRPVKFTGRFWQILKHQMNYQGSLSDHQQPTVKEA